MKLRMQINMASGRSIVVTGETDGIRAAYEALDSGENVTIHFPDNGAESILVKVKHVESIELREWNV